MNVGGEGNNFLKLCKDVSSRHLRTDCFYVSSFDTTNGLTDEEYIGNFQTRRSR